MTDILRVDRFSVFDSTSKPSISSDGPQEPQVLVLRFGVIVEVRLDLYIPIYCVSARFLFLVKMI